MLVHGTYDIAHVGRDTPHGAYYILHGDNVISAAVTVHHPACTLLLVLFCNSLTDMARCDLALSHGAHPFFTVKI